MDFKAFTNPVAKPSIKINKEIFCSHHVIKVHSFVFTSQHDLFAFQSNRFIDCVTGVSNVSERWAGPHHQVFAVSLKI